LSRESGASLATQKRAGRRRPAEHAHRRSLAQQNIVPVRHIRPARETGAQDGGQVRTGHASSVTPMAK
jgi:hypothetical protein